jgi:hypothetical protein
MAANTYLTRDVVTQLVKEILATQSSAGAANANQIVALAATGYLDPSLFPAGLGEAQLALPATETIAAGAQMNLWGGAGGTTPSWRNANATDATKPAMAFCNTGGASGATVTGYFTGNLVTGLTGLTIGAQYFLSTTSGGVVLAAVAGAYAAGALVQPVGVAVSTTSMLFQPASGIIHG